MRVVSRTMKTSAQEILSRIERRLRATNQTDNGASTAAGLSRDAIRTLRRQIAAGTQRGVSTETLEQLAPALKTSPQWLFSEYGPEETEAQAFDFVDEDEAPLAPTVPVKGYVGAGAHAHFLPLEEGELDRVDAPKDFTDKTVALEIRGDSLGELFDRWIVFFDDIRSPVTPDLHGRLCVVELEDGRVLVKKLKRQKNGLYTLLSDAMRQDPIEDAVIRWAAKVKNLVPR